MAPRTTDHGDDDALAVTEDDAQRAAASAETTDPAAGRARAPS